MLRRNVPAHLVAMGVSENVDAFSAERGLQGASTKELLERIYPDSPSPPLSSMCRNKTMLCELNEMMNDSRQLDESKKFEAAADKRLEVVMRIV